MQRNTNRNDELERLRRRYAGRGKEGKGRLLDEFCEHHRYERKYAIKLLQDGRPQPVGGPRPGPEPKYEAVQEVVERIWTPAEQLCGKRLAPALALWLPHYTSDNYTFSRRQLTLPMAGESSGGFSGRAADLTGQTAGA